MDFVDVADGEHAGEVVRPERNGGALRVCAAAAPNADGGHRVFLATVRSLGECRRAGPNERDRKGGAGRRGVLEEFPPG